MTAESVLLFPFAEYWWFYLGTVFAVLLLLALDLGVFHRTPHAVGFKEALAWSVVWLTIGLLFSGGLYYYVYANFDDFLSRGASADLSPHALALQVAVEYLTGFVVEKSLAIDNIFVFAVVFTFFAIPQQYQHRILFYGILGALIFRAIFIAMSSVLMRYEVVVLIFGALLILTGIKMFFAPSKMIEADRNPLIKLLKRFVPVTDKLHGAKFFVKINGITYATPALVALLTIELTDVIFAIDSVPAIFAITKEPLLVFTSNIFAILGLRALYFLLAGILDRFRLLKFGLAAILIFVGLKMVWLNELYGGKFPVGLSLGIVVGILVTSILASLYLTRREGKKEA